MESVAEAMEFFRFGNAGKTQVKYVILAFALASVVLPYGANAMPMPRKYNYIYVIEMNSIWSYKTKPVQTLDLNIRI